MIALLQLLNSLNKKQRKHLLNFIEFNLADGHDGKLIVNHLTRFLNEQLGLIIEMNDVHRDGLVRIIENGAYKSAFRLTELKKGK